MRARRLLGSPLFWIALVLGGMLVLALVADHVPELGIGDVYHLSR